MKKFVLSGIVAATLTVALASAWAKDPVLTVSGTAVIQKTNYENSSSVFIGTTASSSFNNKQVYNLISNAVANASSASFGAISSAILPANGYIAFNAQSFDGQVSGIFYVTNKTGFFYQLSGTDGNGNYYSWIELDTQNNNSLGNLADFGWGNTNIVGAFPVSEAPFNGVATINASDITGSGKETDTSTGLLYIHDDPYAYDDADDPDIFWSNNLLGQGLGNDFFGSNFNALEIRGIVTTSATYKGFNAVTTTLSMTGTGNFVSQGNYESLVKTGTATLK